MPELREPQAQWCRDTSTSVREDRGILPAGVSNGACDNNYDCSNASQEHVKDSVNWTAARFSETETRLMDGLAARMETRLQKSVVAVTAHLEASIEKQVQEAHDGIAARIEDVTAAHVDRARAEMAESRRSSCRAAGFRHDRSISELDEQTSAVSRGFIDDLKKVQADCTSLQRRQDDLEALVMRIATSTARDAAAARADSQSELRAIGNGLQLAMERVEEEVTSLRRLADEDRTAINDCREHAADESWVRSEFPTCSTVSAWVCELRMWITSELEDIRGHISIATAGFGGHSIVSTPMTFAAAASEPATEESSPCCGAEKSLHASFNLANQAWLDGTGAEGTAAGSPRAVSDDGDLPRLASHSSLQADEFAASPDVEIMKGSRDSPRGRQCQWDGV